MSEKPDIALSDTEWTIVQKILHKHLRNHHVWAFGSRTTGRHHALSDLGLAIIGDHALSFASLGELRQAFDESDLPWKVDLVDWHDIGEDFRRIIESHRIQLQ
ncbi:MAG: nucleotidyltransferase family protein [Betaproteobacteria bacterium]